jgi:hypothetical protein
MNDDEVLHPEVWIDTLPGVRYRAREKPEFRETLPYPEHIRPQREPIDKRIKQHRWVLAPSPAGFGESTVAVRNVLFCLDLHEAALASDIRRPRAQR